MRALRFVPDSLAWSIAFHVAYDRLTDPATIREGTWKRVAFVCRYGHTGLDALTLPGDALNELMHALGELVAEENAANTQ